MRFWTSDLHFGHKNVIPYCNRPFKDVEEMEAELIRRWNVLVGKEDTTIVLGDFAFYKPNKIKPILEELNGQKVLIKGNHDHSTTKLIGHPYFTMVTHHAEFFLANGEKILASHYPYKGEEADDRYPERHQEDKGLWLLHGHVHQHWKKKGRMINVGVDVWGYAPVSEDEIIKEIESARHLDVPK